MVRFAEAVCAKEQLLHGSRDVHWNFCQLQAIKVTICKGLDKQVKLHSSLPVMLYQEGENMVVIYYCVKLKGRKWVKNENGSLFFFNHRDFPILPCPIFPNRNGEMDNFTLAFYSFNSLEDKVDKSKAKLFLSRSLCLIFFKTHRTER